MPPPKRKPPPLQLWKEMTASLPEFLALPDEIKVMILKYILPTGLTLTAGNFNRKLSAMPDRRLYPHFVDELHRLNGLKTVQKEFDTDIFPLLAVIPAIRIIVYDVLFDFNKITICRSECKTFCYPPASMNACVRRVQLRTETDDAGLAFMCLFASGALGLSNLDELDIALATGSDGYTDEEYALVSERLNALTPIKFTAKKLTVSFEHFELQEYHSWESRTDVTIHRLRDELDTVVLGKMLLVNGKEDKTRWERYDCIKGDGGGWCRREDDDDDGDWPETEEWDLYGPGGIDDTDSMKKTVKIMEF
jgi:hypothetical protein